MGKVDHQKERIELLSSPFLETPSKHEEDAKEVVEEKLPPVDTKTHRISQSPLRFREKLYCLFGGKNPVDQHLKSIADAEDQQEKAEQSQDGGSGTMKSIETRGSSLITEQQTYYNTLRNQYIDHNHDPIALEREIENRIPMENLPPSRIFLSIYPEQIDFYKKEKELAIKKMEDYALLYKWNLWSDIPSTSTQQPRPGTSESLATYVENEKSQRRKLKQEYSIDTKIKLNEVILGYKKQLKEPLENLQVHIFKDGIKPKKNSKELVNGGIIAIQVSLRSKSYTLWKSILRVVLDDKFQNQEDPEVYQLKNTICGLSFILKNHELENYKVMLVKFWLQPYFRVDKISQSLIVNLCHLIHDNLEVELQSSVAHAKYIDNKTHKIHKVFNPQ